VTIKHPSCQDIPALRALWKEAFGDTDAFLDAFFATGFSPERCCCIRDGETIAAALYWFACSCRGEPIAYLYAVATAKSHRGQGLCSRLMAHTHALLKEQGYAGVILVPGSEDLFRFYGRMGYRICSSQSRFFTAAAQHPLSLRQLDGETYAARRKNLLPAGAVLQEGPGLAFLQTQMRFYAGEDFLLAAAKEGTSLFAAEFLGNHQAAGRILAALGAAEGTFRTPGEDIPFAMYYPLRACPAPDYLGFAYD